MSSVRRTIWCFQCVEADKRSGERNRSPWTYTFNFTPSVGPQPSGQFTYDALANLNSRFTAFTVNASSLIVDFTSIANFDISSSVGECGIPRTSEVLFAYLQGSCGARGYEILDFATLGAVELSASAAPGFSQLGIGTSRRGAGVFTVQPSASPPSVPEPSTVWLALGAIAALAGAAKPRA